MGLHAISGVTISDHQPQSVAISEYLPNGFARNQWQSVTISDHQPQSVAISEHLPNGFARNQWCDHQ